MAILDDVIASNPETPDECLYGRVGYLYSLLFVRKHLGPQSIDPAALKKKSDGRKVENIRTKWASDTTCAIARPPEALVYLNMWHISLACPSYL
ncbi:hypothetical protein J6590_066772 [Homalodisca vitripennis]|nr:hypothetical protein J6590_066772 [Homalodisca vitripennis]